jgi:hypothetical protein
MKPCAHFEALEAHALGDGVGGASGANDAWLEAHVAECEACGAELDRLLEERALFVRRARAVDVALDPSGVFAELDRRRERLRKSAALGSMLVAAAACMAMAFAPITSSGVRAAAFGSLPEPAQPELGAIASWDEAPMTMRVAACMAPSSDRAACDAPAEARATSGGSSALASGGWSVGSSWPAVCVADVTCSVARP